MTGDLERSVDRMVQVGRVDAVNLSRPRVRVYFPETEIVSDWLYCVGSVPQIGEMVVVLYEARRGGDGFVMRLVRGAEGEGA